MRQRRRRRGRKRRRKRRFETIILTLIKIRARGGRWKLLHSLFETQYQEKFTHTYRAAS
jgi:hypothetical protein